MIDIHEFFKDAIFVSNDYVVAKAEQIPATTVLIKGKSYCFIIQGKEINETDLELHPSIYQDLYRTVFRLKVFRWYRYDFFRRKKNLVTQIENINKHKRGEFIRFVLDLAKNGIFAFENISIPIDMRCYRLSKKRGITLLVTAQWPDSGIEMTTMFKVWKKNIRKQYPTILIPKTKQKIPWFWLKSYSDDDSTRDYLNAVNLGLCTAHLSGSSYMLEGYAFLYYKLLKLEIRADNCCHLYRKFIFYSRTINRSLYSLTSMQRRIILGILIFANKDTSAIFYEVDTPRELKEQVDPDMEKEFIHSNIRTWIPISDDVVIPTYDTFMKFKPKEKGLALIDVFKSFFTITESGLVYFKNKQPEEVYVEQRYK
jgi:hypothetical protein